MEDRIWRRFRENQEVMQEAIEVIQRTNEVFHLLNKAGVPELIIKLAEKMKEGKEWVFVDKRLLEWVDEQVDAENLNV